MAAKGREKHFFLGGNTPKGFFSYYDHLVPQETARKIYCIKGGAGNGEIFSDEADCRADAKAWV